MKVILLKKVRNLGELGDTVDVKAGYGRNYLIPQGVALRATSENLAYFESKRSDLEKAALEALQGAEKRAAQLKDLVLTIPCKVHEENKLFGSVNVREIADALDAKGIVVEKREINLPLGPIRETGEYDVEIPLHSDVKAMIKVNVIPEA